MGGVSYMNSILLQIGKQTSRVPPIKWFGPLVIVILFAYFGALRITQVVFRKEGNKVDSFVKAKVLGVKMRLNPGEFVDCALLLFPQFYDNRELDYMRKRLKPGDVFVDVGSHIGLYSMVASGKVGPTGRVLALEASPETFARLQWTIADNAADNIQPVHVGVSDREETLTLSMVAPPFEAASTFLIEEGRGARVRCRPLLDVLQENGVDHVTGMKLDIEGFEHRVLTRFLADADESLHPEWVIVEVNPALQRAGAGDPLPVLKEHGYRLSKSVWMNHILVKDRARVPARQAA